MRIAIDCRKIADYGIGTYIRGLLDGRNVRQVTGASDLFAPDAATWADPTVAGGGYGHAQLTHATGLLFFLTPLRASRVFAEMTAPGSSVELYDAVSVRYDGGAAGVVSGAGTVPRNLRFRPRCDPGDPAGPGYLLLRGTTRPVHRVDPWAEYHQQLARRGRRALGGAARCGVPVRP